MQREALLKMYNNSGLWEDETSMIGWEGITLDAAGNVIGIVLDGDNDIDNGIIGGESIVLYPLDNLDFINDLTFLETLSIFSGILSLLIASIKPSCETLSNAFSQSRKSNTSLSPELSA